jgi:hypothetical protein
MDPQLYESPNPTDPGGRPIRRFLESTINRDINSALATLEPGKTGAIIVHADLHGNFGQSLVVRLGDHWSVAEAFYKDAGKPPEGEVAVRFDW